MAERATGVIRRDEVYRVDEFRRRAGMGDFSFREVRKAGLRVVKIGKKLYVRGVDWIDFVDTAAAVAAQGGEVLTAG